MKIGEQHLPFPDQLIFRGQGFLNVHDHFGLRIYRDRTAHHLRPGLFILGINELTADTGTPLDQYLVAAFHQHLDSGRSHADSIFLCLDFLENADEHRSHS